MVWGNIQNDLNPLKLVLPKGLYFSQKKKLFKISDTEIFICFALNQLNILICSKIYKSMLLRIINTLSTAKISPLEMCKGYLSHPRKHTCAKDLKNLPVKKKFR